MSVQRSISLVLLVLGVVASVASGLQTLGHVPDPDYRSVNLPIEEGSSPELTASHSNYHAFREFLLVVTVVGVLAWLVVSPGRLGAPWVRTLALVLGLGYSLGWWLPWMFYGLRAPHLTAELVHAIATVGLIGAILTSPGLPESSD
jgi:hypothetical protein